MMMLEFPTFGEATAWYNSPAYQVASEHRFMGADYRAIIVEGVAPRCGEARHVEHHRLLLRAIESKSVMPAGPRAATATQRQGPRPHDRHRAK
jgi:hypothetical protein